ncbi:MAG: hypothetical protein RLZZ187_2579 [Pseudomonadota bacterium]|jgi:hypothetical protein
MMDVPKGWTLAAREWGQQRERRRHANGGRILGLLVWNEEAGEGEVLLVPGFTRADGVFGKDALSDWCGLLEREYSAWRTLPGRVGYVEGTE